MKFNKVGGDCIFNGRFMYVFEGILERDIEGREISFYFKCYYVFFFIVKIIVFFIQLLILMFFVYCVLYLSDIVLGNILFNKM